MCRLTCIFFLEPDFFEDEFWTEFKVKNESEKAPQVHFFPKEEELSEEEQEKILQEPYMPGSSVEKIFNTYSTSVENSVLRVQHYVFHVIVQYIVFSIVVVVCAGGGGVI